MDRIWDSDVVYTPELVAQTIGRETDLNVQSVRFLGEVAGAQPEGIWKLARFRAVFHTLAITEFAQETERWKMLSEGLKSLAWILDGENGSLSF